MVGDYARFATGLAAGLPWTLVQSRGEFMFEGERHPYLFHRHKWTWLTERAVEVPVVQAIVDRHAGKRILEVGNVLSHYRSQRHLVVDRHEQAPGVINRDVLDLSYLGHFDLVISISTLEHVGWDEAPRDPDKAPEAVRRLTDMLAPGGRLLVSVPLGYHPPLDAAFRSGSLPATRIAALRRSELGPHWRQTPVDSVWDTPYDFLLYGARAVFFATIERSDREPA